MKNITLAICAAAVTAIATATAATETHDDSQYRSFALKQMIKFYESGIDEKLYLATDKPYFSAGEQIWCKPILRNAITHAPLELSNFVYVELVDRRSELVQRVKIRRDSTGFDGYINLDPKLEPGDYTLRAYTRWMLNKNEEFLFAKQIEIVSPIPQSDTATETPAKESKRNAQQTKKSTQSDTPQQFDLQFMPEGGALLAGGSQIVALKAIADDGLSVEVEGEIHGAEGDIITTFASQHNGMGITTLFVDPSQKYTATAWRVDDPTNKKMFDLPAVDTIGAVVTTSMTQQKLLFKPRASHPQLLDNAHFIIHAHGKIVSINRLRGEATCTIPIDQLFDGVNVVSLVNNENKIVSERVVFKYPNTTPQLKFETDKKNYKAREKVKLTIARDIDSLEIPHGEFAVAVTDNSAVQFDPDADNIVSSLLLTSEIVGNVEKPAQYFDTADRRSAAYNLDLLLKTQAWRRYSIEEILTDNIKKTDYSYETEAEITGNVKGFFGNDARKPKIYILCNKPSLFDVFDLDETSKFRLVGLDIPDSTTYVVQARGKRGGSALSLTIDPDPFATPKSSVLRREEMQQSYVPMAFVNQSQDKFFYEGGMNMINLEAVSVTTTKEEASGISAFASHSTTRDDLEAMGSIDLATLIQSYPSMSVSTEGVTYRGSTSFARFIVDDMYMEYEDLTYMTTADIEQIEFLDSTAAVMYSDASGGIFVITLRKGATVSSDITPLNIANVAKLGYQRHATLYQPNYEVESLRKNLPPDYRTTIYWNGAAQPNSDGEIYVEFFTADKPTDYTVTIEGVCDNGEIYRATSTIERK
ncbi:MAG: TonB-dependent receptor plug domain-containing protein [Rikenellaceae bacterium]